MLILNNSLKTILTQELDKNQRYVVADYFVKKIAEDSKSMRYLRCARMQDALIELNIVQEHNIQILELIRTGQHSN